MKKFLLGAALLGILAVFVSTPLLAAPPHAVMDIQFNNGHKSARTLQDVFVERNDIATSEVARLEAKDLADASNMLKAMFAAAVKTQPDPGKRGANPLGPFPKGVPLGFTVDQWVAATGTGTYTPNGDNSELRLSFKMLVPNGVYTAWCGIRGTIACGAPDGSQATMKADAQGNGTLVITGMKELPATGPDGPSVVAMAYHSDGKTCGPSPCDFGLNSHVQLEWVLPAAAAAPPPAPQTVPTAGADFSSTTTLGLALALGIGLVLIGWYLRKRAGNA